MNVLIQRFETDEQIITDTIGTQLYKYTAIHNVGAPAHGPTRFKSSSPYTLYKLRRTLRVQ